MRLSKGDQEILISAVAILRRAKVYQDQTTAGGYVGILADDDGVTFETLHVDQFDFNGCDAPKGESAIMYVRRAKAAKAGAL